jgi:hypothetical protein
MKPHSIRERGCGGGGGGFFCPVTSVFRPCSLLSSYLIVPPFLPWNVFQFLRMCILLLEKGGKMSVSRCG